MQYICFIAFVNTVSAYGLIGQQITNIFARDLDNCILQYSLPYATMTRQGGNGPDGLGCSFVKIQDSIILSMASGRYLHVKSDKGHDADLEKDGYIHQAEHLAFWNYNSTPKGTPAIGPRILWTREESNAIARDVCALWKKRPDVAFYRDNVVGKWELSSHERAGLLAKWGKKNSNTAMLFDRQTYPNIDHIAPDKHHWDRYPDCAFPLFKQQFARYMLAFHASTDQYTSNENKIVTAILDTRYTDRPFYNLGIHVRFGDVSVEGVDNIRSIRISLVNAITKRLHDMGVRFAVYVFMKTQNAQMLYDNIVLPDDDIDINIVDTSKDLFDMALWGLMDIQIKGFSAFSFVGSYIQPNVVQFYGSQQSELNISEVSRYSLAYQVNTIEMVESSITPSSIEDIHAYLKTARSNRV